MPATSEMTHDIEGFDNIENSVTNLHRGKTGVCRVTLFIFCKSKISPITKKET